MIRIDQLPATLYPDLLHAFAAMKDGETVQLTILQVLDLVRGNLAETAPGTLDTIDEIAAALQDNPDVITTLLEEQALRLKRDGSNFADPAEVATFRAALGLSYADLPFLSVPVGGLIALPTHITGVAEPGTDSALFRFAKLTAGLTGGGGYNNGVLTSESVSGSAPLVLATATVSLAGSPINGQSVRLLNTEGRFIRPGTSSGTVANDTMQDHDHPQIGRSSGAGTQFGTGNSFGTAVVGSTGMASAQGWRTGTETAPKHIQLTHYMRVM